MKRAGLLRRRLRVSVTASARSRLAELGYHPTRGARPLRRLIEERVMTPIAAKIAEDPELRDATITVAALDERATTGAERSFVVVVA